MTHKVMLLLPLIAASFRLEEDSELHCPYTVTLHCSSNDTEVRTSISPRESESYTPPRRPTERIGRKKGSHIHYGMGAKYSPRLSFLLGLIDELIDALLALLKKKPNQPWIASAAYKLVEFRDQLIRSRVLQRDRLEHILDKIGTTKNGRVDGLVNALRAVTHGVHVMVV